MDGQVGFELQEPHRLFYGVAISDIRRWRGSNAIAGAAGWRYGADVVLAGAVPVRATARDITEGYFRVYGVTVSPGRDFTTADTARGAAPVVIVSRKMVLPAASTPSIATRTGCGRLTAAVRVAMSLTISSRRVGVRMVEVV